MFWIQQRETKRASIPVSGSETQGPRRKNSHYLRKLHKNSMASVQSSLGQSMKVKEVFNGEVKDTGDFDKDKSQVPESAPAEFRD